MHHSMLFVGSSQGYWLIFFIIPLVLGMAASNSAKKRLTKYSETKNSAGITGLQAAQNMLEAHNVKGVASYTGADGQDFYNPKNNSITLSQNYTSTPSVAAIAVACHEAGHACQYHENYWPIKFRNSLVPVLNITSKAWIFLLIAGILFRVTGLTYVAIGVFSLSLVFHLVTLPVEFDASKRAIEYINTLSLQEEEVTACKDILRSCAMTYVVAALVSAMQLIWIIMRQQRN